MRALRSSLVCSGCGASPEPEEPYPFRCPQWDQGDVDHVLVRRLDLSRLSWPADSHPNPFLRYRSLMYSFHLAMGGGLDDAGYRRLLLELDRRVADVDGHGFSATPFVRADELSSRLGFAGDGGVWVKDETNNVSGSHKARHLMGVALHLAVAETLGLLGSTSPRLAIASCGNAALAAAVVARAAGRELEVFVPAEASTAVITRLEQLGARVTLCPRSPGVRGDPAFHRLRSAVATGAVPFTCQGSENGLVIEGGETLGWEIVSSGTRLDRVVVQVGGGALATSVMQSFREACELGAMPSVPRLDTVQTSSAHPLQRAYDRVAERLATSGNLEATLRYAATHRAEFMWPWESEPRSVATGILDDETYDWFAVVSGMLHSKGAPVVVEEATLEEANELARSATGIDVDHTGSSGLAGLVALVRRRQVDPRERVGVLFTGVRR